MLLMLNKSVQNKIYHSKLQTELFTVAIHIGLNKIKFLRQKYRVQLCQGNLEWRHRKVREMSGNFVLSFLYEPWYHGFSYECLQSN